MHDFALTEEFQGLAHIGVIHHTKQVIIGYARFLFCRKVLVDICKHVAFNADIFHIGGHTCGACGVDTCRVVCKILRHG